MVYYQCTKDSKHYIDALRDADSRITASAHIGDDNA
jgi:hypothetical protein